MASVALSVLWLFPAGAADLSFSEAEAIIRDTYTVSRGCMTTASLEAKALAAHDSLILQAALCGYDLMDVPPGWARRRWNKEDAAFFATVPAKYNTAVTHELVAKSALRYSGFALTKHRSVGTVGIFAEIHYENGYYFFMIDGLGGVAPELTLTAVTKIPEGYKLSGTLTDTEKSTAPHIDEFTLIVAPGETPGSWKRLSIVETGSHLDS